LDWIVLYCIVILSNMDANPGTTSSSITTIRNKLGRGEELSVNDLRSLDPLHDAIYDHEGCCIVGGDSFHDDNGDADDEPEMGRLVDYLDRSLLDGRNQRGQQQGRLPRLVRYVGMVQDMLDPEYYESYDSRGRSTHFGYNYELGNANDWSNSSDHDCYVKGTTGADDGDNNNSNDNNNTNNNRSSDAYEYHSNDFSDSLAERIPLVVVPIPFASDWLYRGIQEQKSNDYNNGGNSRTNSHSDSAAAKSKSAVVVSPISANRSDRKRERENENENGGGNGVGGDKDSCMNGDEDGGALHSRNANSNAKAVDQQTKKSTVANGEKVNTRNTNINNIGERNNRVVAPHLHGTASDSANADATTTDWWPAGTFGTPKDQCPILAKMCYDQLLSGEQSSSSNSTNQEIQDTKTEQGPKDATTTKRGERQDKHQRQRQRPLMLNDLVSMVGVLSMNPFDADFPGQQNEYVCCRDSDAMMMETITIPPPSRLPRLYVLSYRRFELDDLAQRAINATKGGNYKIDNNNSNGGISDLLSESEKMCNVESRADGDNDDDSEVGWSGFPTDDESLVPSALVSQLLDGSPSSSSALGFPGPAPWIRALWMCLLSEADRQRSDLDGMFEIIRAGPAERALGCISLRLSTPDVTSAKALFRRLAENVLREVCPVVAALDLTKTTANDGSLFPRKDDHGRLKPSPLQLPKGSVLLIHCPPPSILRSNDTNRCSRMTDGSENDDAKDGEIIQAVLHELVKHHRMPYTFEGGVTIPFEADYRVILVTTQTQEFPCTLSVLAGTGSTAMMTEDSLPPATSPGKPELREILVNGRASFIGNNKSLKFSSTLLEQAQKDFLERRRRCHEFLASSSALPGEDDFHRWLTLTKLETKNRRSRGVKPANDKNAAVLVNGENGQDYISSSLAKSWEPTVEDWKVALKLDDDIRIMV